MNNHPIRETMPGKPSRPPHEDTKQDGAKQDDDILSDASGGIQSETKSETDKKGDPPGE